MSFIPRGSGYHVRLLNPATETKGGILLPETSQENETHAEVLAAGPGRALVHDEDLGGDECTMSYSPMYADVGDHVLFPKSAWEPLSEREGVVHDEDLIAVLADAEDEIEPLGEWVLIQPDERKQESAGGIALADRAQVKRRSGVVLNYGPGRGVKKGACAGTRLSVYGILGVDLHPTRLAEDKSLRGKRVFWDAKARTLAVGGFALVKAGDLMAVESE